VHDYSLLLNVVLHEVELEVGVCVCLKQRLEHLPRLHIRTHRRTTHRLLIDVSSVGDSIIVIHRPSLCYKCVLTDFLT